MARSPTTLDPFSAVAEPRRRLVLGTLSAGERPVNDIVNHLGWPQPQVSKHLAVLLDVGLVKMRREGRQRIYRVNGERMKLIADWVAIFERFWEHQLDRIKQRAEAKARQLSQEQLNLNEPKTKESNTPQPKRRQDHDR